MGPLVAVPPEGVPGPRGLPLVGSLVSFAGDPLGFLSRMHAEHGDLVFFWLVEHPVYQVCHPDLIEEVLVRHARVMHKDRIYDLIRPLLGNGLVTAEGDLWKRHRKLAAPSFTPKHVAGYAKVMVEQTRAWASAAVDGARVDAHAELMGLTQRIVLRTLFGTDLHTDGAEVGHAIETFMECFVSEAQGAGRILPKVVPTPSRRRAAHAIAEQDRVIYGLVEARRRAGLGDDLLSRLIAARDDEGAGFSDAELRDEAVTLFVAGHETTALALTYTLLLLGEHPEAEARLRAEVAEVLGDRPAEAADLGRLPYTTAVIKEAMRVLPPVWAIGREAMEDVEIGGRSVKKGSQVLIPMWVLNHDPRWFEAPDRFQPERWLDGLEDRLPRMAWIPFGGGPRVCIGNHFAMLEAVLVLATLSQTAWPRSTGPRPRLLPSITLRPRDPVPAVIERRGSP